MTVEIPRLGAADHDHDYEPEKPGWYPTRRHGDDGELRWTKPTIRCNCGKLCGIALHHVHADGTVTASFFDSAEPYTYTDKNGAQRTTHDPEGCGWHVMLKLLDYDCGDFPPHAE